MGRARELRQPEVVTARRGRQAAPVPPHLALQRLAGNRATARILRHRAETLANVLAGRMSTHNLWFVPDNQQSVWGSAGRPQGTVATGATRRSHGANWSEYTAARTDFVADCLHTAEELLHNRRLRRGYVRSQVAVTGTDFGVSDPANIQAAQAFAGLGRDQRPRNAALGQAFVTVETGQVQGYNYHAAAVIAEDGRDRVTLEVMGNAGTARVAGTFGIYSGVVDFGNRWAGVFTAPVTIVVEAR